MRHSPAANAARTIMILILCAFQWGYSPEIQCNGADRYLDGQTVLVYTSIVFPTSLLRGAVMKTVRWFGITLLFFLAVSATVGSIPLMADPHGNPWSMPQSLLQYSPFSSFLIPRGILLFVANGVLATWALWLALADIPRYGLWTLIQGCVLLGWIGAECFLIPPRRVGHTTCMDW